VRDRKGWVLTTSVRERPDPYTEHIWPITRPLMAAYAARHGMDFAPCLVTRADEAEFQGMRTPGTQAVYASWPGRQQLLEVYEGVVYLDEDVVITNPEHDICEQVSAERPIGMQEGGTGCIVVLKNEAPAREFLDIVWSARHQWIRKQWAEEGCMKALMGWESDYAKCPVGPCPRVTEEAPFFPFLSVLQWGIFHPREPQFYPEGPWLGMNPGGIHPFEDRLAIVREVAEKGHPTCHT